MTTPCGYQAIGTLSSATSLTVPPVGSTTDQQQLPTRCIVTCEAQAVRWRDDGTAPTAAVGGGYPLAVGAELRYDGDLKKIQFIEQVSGAKLNVCYYY